MLALPPASGPAVAFIECVVSYLSSITSPSTISASASASRYFVLISFTIPAFGTVYCGCDPSLSARTAAFVAPCVRLAFRGGRNNSPFNARRRRFLFGNSGDTPCPPPFCSWVSMVIGGKRDDVDGGEGAHGREGDCCVVVGVVDGRDVGGGADAGV